MDEEPQAADQGTSCTNGLSKTQASKPVRPFPQQPSNNEELDKVERKMNSFERSTLQWTRATFFILAATCCFIAFQWHEMESGSKDTHTLAEAAKRQAEKAETISSSLQQAVSDMDAANSNAKRVLVSNIATAHLEQRAWVGMIGLPPPKNFAVGRSPSFGAIFTNSGKTPALDAVGTVMVRTLSKGEPFVPIYEGSHSRTSTEVIQPGMKTSLWTKPKGIISNDGIGRIKAGDFIVYVYGKVEYRDIFKKRHHTTFCDVLDSNLTDYHACNTYNRAD